MSDLDLELDEFKVEDELAEFGVEMKEEKIELAEDLEGFASCFPKWDLLPPKK